MFLRLVIKCIVLLSLLESQYVYALHDKNKVVCPPAHIVQKSYFEIDRAYKFDEGYIAGSSGFVFNKDNYRWKIYVFLWAKSRKDAIELSRNSVYQVKFSKQKYAEDIGNGSYNCTYGPSSSTIISAEAYKSI